MKTVTLEVATLKEVKRRVQEAFQGKKQRAWVSFVLSHKPDRLCRMCF